jgi:ribosomal protein S18 acetylase RimI-like enzyme
MLIRRLTEADAGTFRDLRLRALREHPASFGSSYEEAVTRPPEGFAERVRPHAAGFVLGAFAGDALAGIVGVRRASSPKEQHKAHIWGMYVASEHQGQGIGRALLTRAIAEARALAGLEQLDLAVNSANAPALRLYHACGFTPYGVEPRALKVGDTYYDETLMILRLV